MKLRFIAFRIVLAVALHGFATAQGPVLAPEPADPMPLRLALHRLQAREDFMVGMIDPDARSLITRVKQGMRDLVVEELSGPRPSGASASQVRDAILRRFRKAGLLRRKDAGACYGCYAHGFDVRTKIVAGRPALLAVVLKIDIPWGDDSSLYVFERRGGRWVHVLASEINGYDSVEKSQSRFRYRIAHDAGGWYVVTGSVRNHAASAWQAVTFSAFAPSKEGPFRPVVLAHERRTIYLAGFEDETQAYRFQTFPNYFAVSFPTDANPDGSVWITYGYDFVHGRASARPQACHLGRWNGSSRPCPETSGSLPGAAGERHLDVNAPADDLRRLQRFHAGQRVPGTGFVIDEEYVPEPVASLLTRVKHGMREQIVLAMAHDVDGSAGAKAIEAAIGRRFAQAGLRIRRDDDGLRYGRVFLTRAAELPGHPELRAVMLVIGIPWGDDTSLYVFERQPSGWTPVLIREINGYRDVVQAQAHVSYAVSPAGPDGRWFLVMGSTNNHGASAWQKVTYSVLVPGSDPEHPDVLMKDRQTIYLSGFDDERKAFRIETESGGFRIGFPHDFRRDRRGVVFTTFGYEIGERGIHRKATVCRWNNARGKVIPCSMARDPLSAAQPARQLPRAHSSGFMPVVSPTSAP